MDAAQKLQRLSSFLPHVREVDEERKWRCSMLTVDSPLKAPCLAAILAKSSLGPRDHLGISVWSSLITGCAVSASAHLLIGSVSQTKVLCFGYGVGGSWNGQQPPLSQISGDLSLSSSPQLAGLEVGRKALSQQVKSGSDEIPKSQVSSAGEVTGASSSLISRGTSSANPNCSKLQSEWLGGRH